MKKTISEKSSGLVKLALVLVLILILATLFFNTWVSTYNHLLRFPYVLKGNIFVTLVYMLLLYIFMIVFDCTNISLNKISTLIISEILAIISCNIFVYMVVIIPAAALGFLPILPIIILTVKDIIVILLWSILVYLLSKVCFKNLRLILISNDKNIETIINKFSNRKDLYVIDRAISYNDNLDEVFKSCENYENVLIGDIKSEDRNDIIKYCFNDSKNVYLIPKISDILIKYSDDIFVFDSPIYYSSNFSLPFESRFFKRLIDIVLSLFVIIAFLPIWLIISLIIKLEDGGPIFYVQKRVTMNLKEFDIIKFRSMKQSNSNEVLPTANDDERITKIGKIIRALHIDEIPQFINVLIGDMSVVGPRPERIEHVHLYTKEIPEFTYRYKVKAGITGLAQIYGKYNTTAINKLKLDLIYIKKYTPMFDLELILKTFKVIFMKENTEGFDKNSQEYIKTNAN